MVRWVIRSIPHGELIELFLVPDRKSTTGIQRPWCVLSCLWDGAYKRSLIANKKRIVHLVAAASFLSFVI